MIFVTGSSGYIGKQLVKNLLKTTNEKVIGIDRSELILSLNNAQYKQYNNDILSLSINELASAMRGASTIFHLAASRSDWGVSKAEYELNNVKVTTCLIEAAKLNKINNWIYFGTVGVYGPSVIPLDENSPFNPDSIYSKSKAKAEVELIKAAKIEGWSVKVLRPSAVYSEMQPGDTNISRLIESIKSGKFINIGNGENVKSFSYLHNVIDAVLWLYERQKTNLSIEAFNCIDQPVMTTKELIYNIMSQLGKTKNVYNIPLFLVKYPAKILDVLGYLLSIDLPITSARIEKFCKSTNYSGSKLLNEGFKPKFTSIEGLQKTIDWHRSI